MCRQGGGSNTMIEVERRKVGVLLLQRWEPLGNLVLAHEVLGVPVVCVQGAVFATARVALLLRRIIFRYFHSRHAARTQAQQKYCPLFSAHCYVSHEWGPVTKGQLGSMGSWSLLTAAGVSKQAARATGRRAHDVHCPPCRAELCADACTPPCSGAGLPKGAALTPARCVPVCVRVRAPRPWPWQVSCSSPAGCLGGNQRRPAR